MKPVIKWTGSKRGQSERIIRTFPKKVLVYREPFLGGGHVLGQALQSEAFQAKKYVASDISGPLIKIWRLIKNEPLELFENYRKHWSRFQDDTDYYYEIRDEFNSTGDPKLFLFLTRTCYNGLIRFNSDGEFNTSVHIDRPGIKPPDLYNVILKWHRLFKRHTVEFKLKDYRDIDVKDGDWCYLDPPYFDTESIYHGGLNVEEFYDWLRTLPCGFAFSFDGKTESGEQEVFVPKDIYDDHKLLDSSKSSFRKLKQKDERVYESLYLSYKSQKESLKSKFFEK